MQNHLVHGHTSVRPSATYVSWQSMKTRCTNKKHASWKWYGGRGVTICDKWLDFKAFLKDLGERPVGTTLDRIDPKGNYEPGNCRWANSSVQRQNQTR